MEFRDASLLRIFFGEDDTHGDRPLYEAILRAAHEVGLAGATVMRGIGGYGPSSLTAEHFQFSSEARPIVVEIIDDEAKITAFLPTIEALLDSGAVTIERLRFAVKAPAA